jgi:putative peptidoglycan lipid II flippase
LSQKKQILRSASVIGFFTLLSRVFGYVRDQRLTLLLGTSVSADAFLLAFRIPSIMRRLVGEGSMNAAFIPVFSDYMGNRTREEMWQLANRVFWTIALLLAIVTILGMVFSSAVIYSFSPRGTGDLHLLGAELNRILFPAVFFVGMGAVAIAILNGFQVFGVPAASPILVNAAFILFSMGFVWRKFGHPSKALAVGVVVGAALQFLIMLPQLVRKGMRFDFGFSLRDPGVRRVARLMLPAFFGVGIVHINVLVGTLFATDKRMPVGSLTSLYVGDRIMQLVLGAYAIAVATAILPGMARLAAAGDIPGLKTTLEFSMRIVSFITVPAAVGLIVMRKPIVQILFEHGRFGAESVMLTSRALFYYSLGLPAFAAAKLIVPAFYSTQDTKTPMQIAAVTLVANILFNILLLAFCFRIFQNGVPALATVLAAYLNLGMLVAILRKRIGALRESVLARSLAKVVIASAAMGAACLAGLHLSHFDATASFFPRLGVFLALLGGATAVYFGVARLFRCEELGELYLIVARGQHAEPLDVGLTG